VIRAVAFCPHPPLLVPEVAQGAAAELDDLRDACRTAIRRIGAAESQVIVLGSGDGQWRLHLPTARGSLAPYGVPLEVPLGSDDPGPVELPLPLTIGAWLLRDALGPNCHAMGASVGAQPAGLRSIGAESDATVLVMGDGSARRSTTAPGYFDERAAPFDAAVTTALAAGDPAGLAVDPVLAAELLVGGADAWNAVAYWLAGESYDAELLYDAAPYGVGYFVAAWTRRG
jgi:hypothetical protein